MPYYEADEGEFVDFATLDDWKDRDEAKDAEISRLTAALAEAEARSAALVAGAAAIGYMICAKTRHVSLGNEVEAAIRALAQKEAGE